MDRSFHLTTQAFVPCVLEDGSVQDLSLTDVLVRAHKIREVRDGSPLVTVALHRLLLAVLHRVFGPADLEAWMRLWKAPQFDEARVRTYLEEHHDEFDLCHPDRPFYQTAGDEELEAMKPVSIWRLDLVQGNNATLFDHRTEHESPAVGAAHAARLLVAYQAFALGGGVSKPFNFMHGPLARDGGFLTVLQGDNLHQTLCLNLLRLNERSPHPWHSGPADRPAWERREERPIRKRGTTPDGHLDYLTWQSRRIRLLPDDGDALTFSRVKMLQGLALPSGPSTPEPMCLYTRASDSDDWRARPFEPDRSLWRDSHTLLATADAGHRKFRPPLAILQLADLKDRMLLEETRTFRCAALGLCASQAKVKAWRHETLPLPLAYVGNQRLVDVLGDAVKAAEDAADALRQAARKLALVAHGLDKKPQLGPAEHSLLRKSVGQSLRRYWPRLESKFRGLMADLPARQPADPDEPINDWREFVVQAATDTFNEALAALPVQETVLSAAFADSGKNWSARKTLNVHLRPIRPAEPCEGSV